MLATTASARSFDVISTDTGGVEVVMVPIHDGSLLLQFRGQAIYIDPDGKGDLKGLPQADFIFFTTGAPNVPAAYAGLKNSSTTVVDALTAKQTFGNGIAAEPAGKGLVLTMAGRRFYVTGASAPTAVEKLDAAFVCMSEACAKDPVSTTRSINARVVFPYRYGTRNLKALQRIDKPEVRLRTW